MTREDEAQERNWDNDTLAGIVDEDVELAGRQLLYFLGGLRNGLQIGHIQLLRI